MQDNLKFVPFKVGDIVERDLEGAPKRLGLILDIWPFRTNTTERQCLLYKVCLLDVAMWRIVSWQHENLPRWPNIHYRLICGTDT